MRNDKLKNKLNNIPQDFDQEQLWNAIKLPKKKRKNRIALWFLIFGIPLSGILLFVLKNDDLSANKKLVDTEQISNEKPMQDLPSEQYASLQKTEADVVIDQSQSKTQQQAQSKTQAESQRQTQAEVQAQNNDKSSTGKNVLASPIGTESSDYEQAITNGNNALETKNIVDKKSIITELQAVDPTTNEAEQIASNLSEDNQSSEVNSTNTIDSDINLLQPSNQNGIVRKMLSFSNILSPQIKELGIQQVRIVDVGIVNSNLKPVEQNEGNNKFLISATSFIGLTNHDFRNEGGIDLRSQNEKALESAGISFVGHFNVGKIDLFSGLSFVRYNTQIKNNSQEFLVINSLDGPAQKSIFTEYSLYNSYQYLDLIAGIGYDVFHAQKWSIKPSVQIGYSLNYSVDGEIFNDENEIEKLSQLEGYKDYSKWQGQVNLNISREINDQWSIGLLTYYNTQKSLGKFVDYSHNVSSFGLGLNVIRDFR